MAAESLHGSVRLMLDGHHYFDRRHRACVIDGSSEVGRDLATLFGGFLRREFSDDAFEVIQSHSDSEATVE